MGIRISGIGGYVPTKKLTNIELAMAVDTSDEWIISRTGIRERRIAAPEETASDMGCQAALRCLANAGVDEERGRPDHRRLRDARSVTAGRGLHGAGEDGHRRGAVPRVRRELGVRGVRLRAERRAGDDADRAGALSERAGDRRRHVLEDPQLEGSADVRVLRRRRGRGAAVPDRDPHPAVSLSPGQRRARARVHRRAGRRHAPARHRGRDRQAAEQVRDERPAGLGVRGEHRARDDPRAARRARPQPRTIWTC